MNRAIFILAATVLTAAAPSSRWTMQTKSDPISDARSVSLTLLQKPTLLLLQCDSADTQPFSITVGKAETYLGGSPILRQTTVRFDNRPPEQQLWGYTSSFAVAQDHQREMISAIGASKTLAIRLQDRRGTPVDLIFDLAGSTPQIAKFKTACASIGLR